VRKRNRGRSGRRQFFAFTGRPVQEIGPGPGGMKVWLVANLPARENPPLLSYKGGSLSVDVDWLRQPRKRAFITVIERNCRRCRSCRSPDDRTAFSPLISSVLEGALMAAGVAGGLEPWASEGRLPKARQKTGWASSDARRASNFFW